MTRHHTADTLGINELSIDAPSVDTPSVDVPRVDAPSVDAPSVDAPSIDASSVNARGIDELFDAQEGLATRPQLLALGVPASTIRYRQRPQGPWRRVLKGIVANRTGPLTRWQRLRAALLFAGPQALVTGFAALWAYQIGLGVGLGVRVLIPHARRLKSDGFVVVTRTSRLPGPVEVGACALAPPARAAVDACLRARSIEVVRGVVAAVLRSGLCSTGELLRELEAHQVQHSARLRAVLSRGQIQPRRARAQSSIPR